ncbi:FAD-linked oxidase C-terminal domain-containing protein [Longispora sp. K20-0274]|uniref:FAD-binding oxidoreductase n=1 Tax=Longispora sp. K20-0274 TaxID=3088255 RepID=UPI00399A97E5
MGLTDDLRAALGDRVLTDPDVLETYRRDEADLCAAGTPVAVVRPRSTAEVVSVVTIAGEYGAPIVPQGARTGLAGGANALDGCVVLSMTGMADILEIDPVNRLAVVQPGVVNSAISAAVAAHGLTYPPDPGSWESSTIGGNVSTDAGGMCCVKYGVTSRYVLGLEVVLADGEVLRTGRRTAKGVAGYDLTKLFVGSEGTLGVITEITLSLRPAPGVSRGLAAIFPSTATAGAAVTAIVAGGHSPSLLELIDRTHLVAIEAYRPQGLPTDAAALLLAAVDTADHELEAIADLCRAAGATEVHVATDQAETVGLLAARRLAHPAMEQLGKLIIDDVAVPVSRLAELLDGIDRVAEKHGVTIGVVGHAGDGNMHPNIVVNEDNVADCQAAFDEIMALGLALGGTCSGEHGVGLLKRDWLARELGPVGVRVHHAIKAALDPRGLLNPGKVIPGS